jgi:hypothetical protein
MSEMRAEDKRTEDPSQAPFVSVIVCTHNPRPDYLARCLAGLQAQQLPHSLWELIIIDNASDEMRAPTVDLTWHPNAKLLTEATLGLTSARLRGIREATGDLLVFVDDDNILEAGFLGIARSIAERRPYLGAWSGQCHPVFEKPPEPWTRRYWGNLAIREFRADLWSNLPRLADTMPYGAGLCVRRPVAQRYHAMHESGVRTFQFDRIGTSLLSGGDNDLAATACDLDLGVGIVTSLHLRHLIPPERLTVEYLMRLAEGVHFSSVLLDKEHGLQLVPRGLFGRLADHLRVLCAKPPHRTILRAAFRGRDRALQMAAKMPARASGC